MEDAKFKILIVDDETIVCRNCKRILSEEGHNAFTSTDPGEALQLIKEELFDEIIQYNLVDNKFHPDAKQIIGLERPPMITIPEYCEKFDVSN